MEYAELGQGGPAVSRLGLGCEPLGGTDWGSVDARQAAAAVGRALDLGITLFDTADVYGLGRSEERLSEALGRRRHEVVIVSKFGVAWDSDEGGGRAKTRRDCSPAHVRAALEASLRRLRLERVPVYLIHWPDPATPVAETMAALLQCQSEGKIGVIGVSNFPAALMAEARRSGPVTAIEVSYSLIDRAAERELLPNARAARAGVIAYGTLAQGLLGGRYGPDSRFGDDDRRHRLAHFAPDAWPRNRELLGRLERTARETGHGVAEVAIRWVLEHPSVTCAIVGARSPDQVEANARALGWRLDRGSRQFLCASAP